MPAYLTCFHVLQYYDIEWMTEMISKSRSFTVCKKHLRNVSRVTFIYL